MLKFKEFVAAQEDAKRFVDDLLEQAARQDNFQLTDEESQRMKEILTMFPTILERHGPEHVTHLPSKRLPSLEQYDAQQRIPRRRR